MTLDDRIWFCHLRTILIFHEISVYVICTKRWKSDQEDGCIFYIFTMDSKLYLHRSDILINQRSLAYSFRWTNNKLSLLRRLITLSFYYQISFPLTSHKDPCCSHLNGHRFCPVKTCLRNDGPSRFSYSDLKEERVFVLCRRDGRGTEREEVWFLSGIKFERSKTSFPCFVHEETIKRIRVYIKFFPLKITVNDSSFTVSLHCRSYSSLGQSSGSL